MEEMARLSDQLIRRATIKDVQQLAKVNLDSWTEAYRHLLPDIELDALTPETLTETWHQHLTNSLSRSDTWVVTEFNSVLAYSRFYPSVDSDDDPEKVATIGSIYVLPDLWRKGLGGRLISVVLDAIKKYGFTEATLHVLAGNQRARRFYERGGWVLHPQNSISNIMEGSAPKLRYRKRL